MHSAVPEIQTGQGRPVIVLMLAGARGFLSSSLWEKRVPGFLQIDLLMFLENDRLRWFPALPVYTWPARRHCWWPSLVRLLFMILGIASLAAAGHASAAAATVRGMVMDSATMRPLASATIIVRGTSMGAVSDQQGRYEIRNIPTGNYYLDVSYISYKRNTVQLFFAAESEIISRNILLVEGTSTSPIITITARADQETDASARLTEKNATALMNIISSQTIARYPDASTAETAKRTSGISITRVRGEAREAIIRGMEGKYNNTLIDGVKVPSPSTNTHDVQLDYLPSDLLQRLEVTKSLTPDMEADAIGGSVNLVMRTAPDQFLLRTRIGAGYNSRLISNDLIGFPDRFNPR